MIEIRGKYNNAKVYTDVCEDACKEQIKNLVNKKLLYYYSKIDGTTTKDGKMRFFCIFAAVFKSKEWILMPSNMGLC